MAVFQKSKVLSHTHVQMWQDQYFRFETCCFCKRKKKKSKIYFLLFFARCITDGTFTTSSSHLVKSTRGKVRRHLRSMYARRARSQDFLLVQWLKSQLGEVGLPHSAEPFSPVFSSSFITKCPLNSDGCAAEAKKNLISQPLLIFIVFFKS